MAAKQLPATKLTANDSSAKEELGRVRWESNGKAYRYVLVEDADLAVGEVVEYSDTSGYEVTNDRSGGSSIGRVVAGVAIGTITDGQYGLNSGHIKPSIINGENPSKKLGQPSRSKRLSLAYTAGFIDADGAIVITRGGEKSKRFKEKRRWYSIFVTVSQKNPTILYLLQKKYGGNVQIHKRKAIDKNHKLAHTWRIQANQAYKFLKKIYPKLILKKRQARLAMMLQENIWKHKNKFANTGGLPRKILDYREKLRQENKNLNKPFTLAETEFEGLLNRVSDSPNYADDKRIERMQKLHA